MQTMQKEFGLLVGYSDHTQDDNACIVSIALGASVIEKHFTLDKTLAGPDHSTSANLKEFSRLVNNIRKAESILGSQKKEPCEIEKQNLHGMRRSIVAKKNISKGTVITEEMLTFKRPATGIHPNLFEKIVGREAKKNINEDSFIEFSDLV